MSSAVLERTMCDRLAAFADSLPIDVDAGWQAVIARPVDRRERPQISGRVTAWGERRRVLALAAAAIIAIAAALVGVVTFDSGPASGTPTLPEPLPFVRGDHGAAVALLEQAATEVQNADSGSGPIRYAKTQSYALQSDVAQRSSNTTIETSARQVWVRPDGSAVADSALQDATRSGAPVGAPHNESSDSHWQDINVGLPTAPNQLSSTLLGSDSTGSERDLALAQAVVAHLGEGTATAAQTASMYRLLATLPGAFDAGVITDNAGREGHAVGIPTGYFDAGSKCLPVSGAPAEIEAALSQRGALGQGLSYVVLNPSTGQLYEVESIDTPNPPCGLGLPAGPTIEQYSLILKAGNVAAVGVAMP